MSILLSEYVERMLGDFPGLKATRLCKNADGNVVDLDTQRICAESGELDEKALKALEVIPENFEKGKFFRHQHSVRNVVHVIQEPLDDPLIYHVFLSHYQLEGGDFCGLLASKLEQRGIMAWVDKQSRNEITTQEMPSKTSNISIKQHWGHTNEKLKNNVPVAKSSLDYIHPHTQPITSTPIPPIKI